VGALDRGKQLGVVKELSDIIASAAGDPSLVERTWVLPPSHLKVDGASTGTPTLAASSRRPPASNWLPEHNKALGLTSSPTAVAAGMPRHFGTSRARPARLAEQRGIDKGRVQDLPSVQFRLDVTPAVEPRPGTGHGGDRCSPVIRGAPCGAGGRIQPGAGLASRGAQVDVLTSSLVIQRATFSG